jgi:hypothetical protein
MCTGSIRDARHRALFRIKYACIHIYNSCIYIYIYIYIYNRLSHIMHTGRICNARHGASLRSAITDNHVCVCIYIYIHLCMYVCIYTHIHTYIHTGSICDARHGTSLRSALPNWTFAWLVDTSVQISSEHTSPYTVRYVCVYVCVYVCICMVSSNS